MVVNLSPLEIAEDDCGTERGLLVTLLDKSHVKSMIGRWCRRNEFEDWINFDPVNPEKHIGKKYYFRSPMTCATKHFKICKKCFGQNDAIKTPFVGVLAGQYIAERLTQLSINLLVPSYSNVCRITM
jgi:hypothetical protein